MSNTLFSGCQFEEIMKGWEAKQNNKGVIYYVNNNLQITSWMHPYLKKVLDLIEEKYSLVKYAAYRTSLKLRAIQSQTGIEWMSVSAIKHVFTFDEEQNKEVSCTQALDLITEILVLSYHNHHNLHEAERLGAAEVILNLMMCLYDVNRSGKLRYRSVCHALTALCKAKLNEKYRYFFTFLKDEENKVKKESLHFFINDLMQITNLMKERLAFGTSVNAAVESCLKSAGKPESDWVNEENFYSWLLQEPQTFVWLPTLHRVQATEIVAHDVRCFVCQIMPIIGFRYRCLQCFNYNLCQNCFLHGLSSNQHKLKHPMKEYCFPTTTKDNTKAFLDIMKNKLIRRHRQQLKKNYLPVEDSRESRECLEWQPRYFHSDPEACISASTDSGLAICSDNGDMQNVESCAYFEENEIKTRRGNSPDFLGLPCSTSSPVSSPVVGIHNEVVEFLSKHDIEMQQKGMANKIKQLQQENRILQMKLHAMQKKYDLDKSGLTNAEVYLDYSLEVPTDSLLSPVSNTIADGTLKTEDLVIQHDTLSIVGPITPVQPLSSNNDEAISSLAASMSEKKKLDKDGKEPTTNDSQDQSTHKLGKVDNEKPNVKIENNDSCDTVLSNQLVYQSCDMSLTFEDTGTSLASTTGKSIPNNCTDKPSVVLTNDIYVPCVQMGNTNGSQSVLSNSLDYQSCDMSLDFEETVAKFLKDTTEKPLKDPIKSFYHPDDGEGDKNKEHLQQNNPIGISHEKCSSCTKHLLISESPDRCKLPNGLEASTSTSAFEKGQPRLVFSSSLQSFKSNKSVIKEKQSQLRHKKLSAVNKTVDNRHCLEEKNSNLRISDISSCSMCIDLSEIFPNSVCVSPSYTHHQPLNLTLVTPAKTASKKKPLDPVYMSTPVHADQPHSCSHPTMVTKIPLSNYHDCNRYENKENFTPEVTSEVKIIIQGQSVKKHSSEITPLSTIPQWHRKRILLSCNSVLSNSSNDPTATIDNTGGLTQLFQKADRIGDFINQDVSDMATEDMDEFEKLMMEFEKECMNSHCTEKKSDADEASVLKAVNNLGDAMSDLVQATAKY